MSRTLRAPGPDHPITLQAGARVDVAARGETLARAAAAVILREADYPPVAYVDRAAFDAACLERSSRTSWCPYKGEAAYFHLILANGARLEDAAWSYETPASAVEAIEGRLAFHPNKVDIAAA